MNNSEKFQLYFSFIPNIASDELIFFHKNLLVAMATNQTERFWTKMIRLAVDHSTKLSSNICNELEINLNFHFSPL